MLSAPPFERWSSWTEYDPAAWPRKVERRSVLVPTACFNCEAACGLVAHVDPETFRVRRFEGNPLHPGSRGRNCAKGPATINQIEDPDRILTPLQRVGGRGEGRWERVSWDHAIDTIAARIRKALLEKRGNEIMIHVGRPGNEGSLQRVAGAWGIDGYNSHTNVCSASARLGYALSFGADRPSPDYANARYLLLLNSHLESGHYFNPYAQRIQEAHKNGARVCTIDARLSNTASMSDVWLAPWPGTETALLLTIAATILREGLFDAAFLREQTNWEAWMRVEHPDAAPTFENFVEALKTYYATFTPEYCASECDVDAELVVKAARDIAAAAPRFAAYVWRSAAAGHLWGWQVARALMLVSTLTGSLGVEGSVSPNTWDKFAPRAPTSPGPHASWSQLLFPDEFPLAHYEMSFLLPHLVRTGRGRIDTYFSRVYNPVWTNPDGFSWIEMLRDEERVGCHVALTPTWNESAQWADFVLPMGHGSERHDIQSQETHAGAWIAFRQPVVAVAGGPAAPGEVREEDSFFVDLSWRIDPDGALGVRRHFESPYRAGQKITLDEHYRWVFENAVPGLPEAAAAAGETPLQYMRRRGAFEVRRGVGSGGWKTPSGKIEIFSPTLRDWKWPEQAMPTFVPSHVNWRTLDRSKAEFILLPTFRLPTLIHTRSGNAKWLNEISNTNPLWMNAKDAYELHYRTGDLVRVITRIGYFVNRVWVTEGIRPGVVACSHHLGRWHLHGEIARSNAAAIEDQGGGRYRLRYRRPEAALGVHQNLTFPVQPDPVSGMHCWHQRVRLEHAHLDDRYGDVYVDTAKSREAYDEWVRMTRPGPGPGGLRRPLWLKRPGRPVDEAFRAESAIIGPA